MNTDFTSAQILSRRGLLSAGGLAVGYAALASAGVVADTQQTPLEAQNSELVTAFCLDWATRDVDKLAPYLSDKLVYQMFEGRPDINGLDEFRREVDPFLRSLVRVEWEILRTSAIGQIVVNQRIDRFIAKPGGRSMYFEIAGLFVVSDGKIELWRDYRLPGGKSRIEVERAPGADVNKSTPD
ncbi:MAG: limonene-1,2-epoxide hydrolase family protein [Gammaproteobacteria bacterium]